MTLHLTAALGRYPHTAALMDGTVTTPGIALRVEAVKPISRAFAPMVRELRYDVSEMAIATVLMALAAGVPITLLPVAVAARFQERALLCRTDSTLGGPAELAGKRIGVRSYSQTTGMWLRGILADAEGLDPSDLHWTVFEDAHVQGFQDPPWVSRAPDGADLLAMLRDGEIDAAIVGSDVPSDPAFRTLYQDPDSAGQRFVDRYGFVPVNHLVVMKRSLAADHPDLPGRLLGLFGDARGTSALPFGRDALRPAFHVANRFAHQQGLVPRLLTEEEIWA